MVFKKRRYFAKNIFYVNIIATDKNRKISPSIKVLGTLVISLVEIIFLSYPLINPPLLDIII